MSTTANVRNGGRTSIEVAATSMPSGDEHRMDSVLEGSGELPDPILLPAVDPDAVRSTSGPPLFAAGELELSVKWGMRDYGPIMEETDGR